MDEVENLSIETQRMLLRAMEERRYRPVGGQRDRLMDVRIIAATNEDLQEAVAEKRFRKPWTKPANDIFDGIAFYAGKTMSNGTERYLAGWCPTRIGDGDEDQWGGPAGR